MAEPHPLVAQLRTARRAAAMTQTDVADHLGLNPRSVGQWERGERTPTLQTLTAYASLVGTTITTKDGQPMAFTPPTSAAARAAQAALDPDAFEDALCAAGDYLNGRRHAAGEQRLTGREIGVLMGAVALAVQAYQNTAPAAQDAAATWPSRAARRLADDAHPTTERSGR